MYPHQDKVLSKPSVEEVAEMLRKISTFCNQSTNFAVALRQAQQVGFALEHFLNFTWPTFQSKPRKALILNRVPQKSVNACFCFFN